MTMLHFGLPTRSRGWRSWEQSIPAEGAEEGYEYDPSKVKNVGTVRVAEDVATRSVDQKIYLVIKKAI